MLLAMASLLAAFWLQWGDGWRPCALCWLQRGCLSLAMVGFGYYAIGARRPLWGLRLAFALALGGLVAAWIQFGEVNAGTFVCPLQFTGAITSCAAAGAHPLMGLPIVDWSVELFMALLLLATLIEILSFLHGNGNA
ncbi:hypothetical protein BI364_10350 [Acidihalobacter yilgarnensis]|uniref:Disulfide bond formation protein B n=1 Tax=Acidihalobacter yilgarnensis TaxID=2819280 RepID=A0A1D8IPA3_9GAMM|nr:hypothetical protein BI364_10350 [Acidihalobacter yilgarnensis]